MRWLSGLDGVFGGVFGRVASLLENTPKQNEVISETLPEEPDEVKEIDTAYEEIENLDENEAFKL